jgi:hypothetical protein
MYRDWYRKNVMCKDALDSNILFSKLFQNLQIRSTSEAIAETAGSVMNQHCGKNRHLKPSNFDRELFLEFNLGPQHMLEGLVEDVYYIMKKQFVYKKNSQGQAGVDIVQAR